MHFKRNSRIALYLAGQPVIFREPKKLKVNKVLVYRATIRYNDTGSVAKHHGGGHQKTATSLEMVPKWKMRPERSVRRSAYQITKELRIFDLNINRILKNDLKVKHNKILKYDPTTKQQQVRLERAKKLLRLCANGQFANIVFSDVNLFTG